MNTKEKIAMKCTRAEYESIKEYIGDLKNTCESDFDRYKYLSTPYDGVGQSSLLSKSFMDSDRRVYKTFDKVVYLKACGIDPNKIIFDMVREHFKDAEKCISLLGNTFKIEECDFETLNIDCGTVFVKRKGSFEVSLYELKTKKFATIATIVSPKRSKLSDSILLDFNPFPHSKWLDKWEYMNWAGGPALNADQIKSLSPKIKIKPLQPLGAPNAPKGPVHLTRVDIENILGYEIKIIKDV